LLPTTTQRPHSTAGSVVLVDRLSALSTYQRVSHLDPKNRISPDKAAAVPDHRSGDPKSRYIQDQERPGEPIRVHILLAANQKVNIRRNNLFHIYKQLQKVIFPKRQLHKDLGLHTRSKRQRSKIIAVIKCNKSTRNSKTGS
jgi:hypothetical protein